MRYRALLCRIVVYIFCVASVIALSPLILVEMILLILFNLRHCPPLCCMLNRSPLYGRFRRSTVPPHPSVDNELLAKKEDIQVNKTTWWRAAGNASEVVRTMCEILLSYNTVPTGNYPEDLLGVFWLDGSITPQELTCLSYAAWSENGTATFIKVNGCCAWTYSDTLFGRILARFQEKSDTHGMQAFDFKSSDLQDGRIWTYTDFSYKQLNWLSLLAENSLERLPGPGVNFKRGCYWFSRFFGRRLELGSHTLRKIMHEDKSLVQPAYDEFVRYMGAKKNGAALITEAPREHTAPITESFDIQVVELATFIDAREVFLGSSCGRTSRSPSQSWQSNRQHTRSLSQGSDGTALSLSVGEPCQDSLLGGGSLGPGSPQKVMRFPSATPASLWEGAAAVTLSIFAGTWNLGNCPPPVNLCEWIRPGYDIYVISSQECKYTPPTGFHSFAEHWFFCVGQCLPECSVVCTRSMWKTHIICLASHRVRSHIHRVESSSEATGVGHFVPNKGGVALSFFVGDTSVCAVSSHLAAHQGEVERRCTDIADIIDGIRLGDDEMPFTNQFTHVIWMGDLNFRIDLEAEEADRLARERDWKTLYEHDQLRKARAAEHALYLFKEGPLSFPPTYKHQPGAPPDASSGVRPYSATKNRTPSWCDRVLWSSFPEADLNLIPGSYQSAPSVCSSDHSPVSAVFEMSVPKPVFQVSAANVSHLDLIIRISGLRARNLLAVSDPFVVFTSRCSDDRAETAAKTQTLEPDWLDDRFILRVNTGFSGSKQLATWHVLASVLDEVPFKDDVMGYGAISLRGAALEGGPQQFTTVLTKGGKRAGTLSGVLEICDGESALEGLSRRQRTSSQSSKKLSWRATLASMQL